MYTLNSWVLSPTTHLVEIFLESYRAHNVEREEHSPLRTIDRLTAHLANVADQGVRLSSNAWFVGKAGCKPQETVTQKAAGIHIPFCENPRSQARRRSLCELRFLSMCKETKFISVPAWAYQVLFRQSVVGPYRRGIADLRMMLSSRGPTRTTSPYCLCKASLSRWSWVAFAERYTAWNLVNFAANGPGNFLNRWKNNRYTPMLSKRPTLKHVAIRVVRANAPKRLRPPTVAKREMTRPKAAHAVPTNGSIIASNSAWRIGTVT